MPIANDEAKTMTVMNMGLVGMDRGNTRGGIMQTQQIMEMDDDSNSYVYDMI